MDISVKALEEAVSIRRQIDNLAAIRKTAGTKKAAPSAKKGGLTPAGRRRLSQLMKARWAARRKAAGRK